MREGENVHDEKQDILYRAAAVWKELTGYHYRLTYGYKGELHQINLTFSPEDFPHLAGFHYLKDLALPRYSPRKMVDMILSGKITHETVRKGAQYRELVEPRLMALVRLKEILEQDFDLFSYVPRFYPFVTKIKADYLISSQGEPTAFVFIIKESPSGDAVCDFLCCSALKKVTVTTARTSVPVPCSRRNGCRSKPLTRWCCTTVCQRIPNNERCPPAYENHRQVGIVFFMGCS